jgi:hypothetical protein
MKLLATLLVTLLTRVAAQASIQGFVYWDADFNGVLSEGVLDQYGTYLKGALIFVFVTDLSIVLY